MAFPVDRSRRLRKSEAMRRLVRETRLHQSDFLYPMFVNESIGEPQPVDSMPGVNHLPLDRVAQEATRVFELGVPGVLLFGIPSVKDATGSASLKPDGIVQRAVREIKRHRPEILVVTDVCLCEYTDHGHCGVIKDNDVDNDATLDVLARQSLSHADAGADMVAPSDMMDGRVQAIRRALDANGFADTAIMAYSVKYASAFYGPFRDAAGSAPKFGDRKTYQMDPSNAREALKEIRQDIDEGADIVMVKPALACLDIIAKARQRFDIPIAAYNVSGEYTMAKLAAQANIADERQLVLEIVTSIKRAGADIIISYHAPNIAAWLRQSEPA
jgi:porphobilinogen synthase